MGKRKIIRCVTTLCETRVGKTKIQMTVVYQSTAKPSNLCNSVKLKTSVADVDHLPSELVVTVILVPERVAANTEHA
jgi:hypothetical protein